jgi:hypothetical protein
MADAWQVFEYLDPSVLGSFDALAEKEWRVVGRMSGSALRKKRGCEWAMTIDICDTKTGKAVFRATWKVHLSADRAIFLSDVAP